MNLVILSSSITLLFFTVLFHEFVHWLALKRNGFDGKFVITKRFLFLFSFGIKPKGVKDNFIHARDIQKVLVAPLIPCAFLYALVFLIVFKKFTIETAGWSLGIGGLFSLFSSSFDLFRSYKIKKWWIKPNRKHLT